MKKFFHDFREFAVRGNLIDLAIGIIIGAAFNGIVNSLVKDIIMPPFGLLFGEKDFTEYKFLLRPAEVNAAGDVITTEVAINYGNFFRLSLDFFIVALSIFLVIRLFNSLKRKAEDENETSIPTPKDIQLLAEIRDILKKQNSQP